MVDYIHLKYMELMEDIDKTYNKLRKRIKIMKLIIFLDILGILYFGIYLGHLWSVGLFGIGIGISIFGLMETKTFRNQLNKIVRDINNEFN